MYDEGIIQTVHNKGEKKNGRQIDQRLYKKCSRSESLQGSELFQNTYLNRSAEKRRKKDTYLNFTEITYNRKMKR